MIDDTDTDSGLPEPPPDDGPGLFGGPAAAKAVAVAAAPVAAAAPATPYRVLARAYRPTRFDDLIGQDAMVRILRRAFELNRVAHAFMLTGVRGVGKTTSARIIARALNCIGADGTGGPTADPCGVCPNCVAILADRHPDVLEMDAASRTGIEDVREIIEATRFRPMQARMKVFIIDEVHMLSRNAFNALLKTLEEPPSQVTFIFATTELRKVPVTVLSRCQRFDLRRVSIGELSSHFARIAAREGAAIDADALALIARAADGSVRDGLSLLDQAIAQGPSGGPSGGASGSESGSESGGPSSGTGEIGAEQVADMLGLADRGLVFDLLDAVMAGRADTALGITDQAHARGADLGQMLADLLELVHTVSRLKSIPALRGNSELPEFERVRGAALADQLSVPVLGRTWQMLLKGVGEVEGAPDRREAAEMVLIRLCHVAELPTPGELVRLLQAEGAGATVRPVAAPLPPQPAVSGRAVSGQAEPDQAEPDQAVQDKVGQDRVGQEPPAARQGASDRASPAMAVATARSAAIADAPDPAAVTPSVAAGASIDVGSAPVSRPAAELSVVQPPTGQPSVGELFVGQAPGAILDSGAEPVAGPLPTVELPVVVPPVAPPPAQPDPGASPAARSAGSPPPAALVALDASSSPRASGGPPSVVQTTPRADASSGNAFLPVAGLTGGGALRAPDPDAEPSAVVATLQHAVAASAQPTRTLPQRTGPERTGPERTGPEQTRPEQTRPEQTRPEQTRPEQTRPEQTGSGQTGPVQSGSVQPDSGPPASGQSDAGQPRSGRSAPEPLGPGRSAHGQPVSALDMPESPSEEIAASPSAPPPALRSWREVVAFVHARRMVTLHGNLMHCAHLVRFRPPVIELALEHGAPRDLSQRLGAVLHEATGNRWSIVIVRDEPGEPTLAQQAGLVQADLDRDAETHPLLQAILAAFPGAVVGPVSDRSLDEYYALPPEQGGTLLAEDRPDGHGPDGNGPYGHGPDGYGDAPPDMEFAPEGALSVGLDDLAAADRG